MTIDTPLRQPSAPPVDNGMPVWRRQLGQRATIAARNGPRPFAVVSYRTRGPLVAYRIALRHLTLVALFDERLPDGDLATRLVGLRGEIDGAGLRFGGPHGCRFDKDLRLAPAVGARGPRLDTADAELFAFALQLERYLERCSRHPYMPRRTVPRLPDICSGEGAASAGECFVDLTSLPKRQVLVCADPRRALCGKTGSTAFDFYSTDFRRAT